MTRRAERSIPIVATVVSGLIASAALAGCSNSEGAANRQPYDGTTSAPAGQIQAVTLKVDNSFRFTPSTIVVHRGMVRVTLDHGPIGAPHNWQLLGLPSASVPTIQDGQTASVVFTAPSPGKYTFVCTIHERQGQTGTLIVLNS